jgi:DNA-binding IclR family transcriptional regulator
LDELLEFLAHDGAQHSIREIAKAINVPLHLCRDMTAFLAKYEFIQFNGRKVMINPHIRELISTTLYQKVTLTPYP